MKSTDSMSNNEITHLHLYVHVFCMEYYVTIYFVVERGDIFCYWKTMVNLT